MPQMETGKTSKSWREKQRNTPIVEKWVHNTSKHELSPTERSTLSTGLNLAITPPKNIPHKEFSRQDSQIVQNQLQTDRTLKKATKLLTIQDTTRLLQFITTSTYFQLLLVFGYRDGETLLDTHTNTNKLPEANAHNQKPAKLAQSWGS